MLMANPALQLPLIGLEYRRHLAVYGDAPAACAASEPATTDDIIRHRKAIARKPDAPEPDQPGDSPQRVFARRIAHSAESQTPGMFTDVFGAWLESWPAFESGCNSIGGWSWQTWVSMLNFAGIPGAGDELDLLDAEPLAENEHDEQMAIRSGWAREQMIRNIWRERYGISEPGTANDEAANDERAADAEEQFAALVDSLAGMTNEEIMEEQDRLRMERQERYVAKQREKNQRYRERPEKVDPRQMMLGGAA